MNQGTLTGVLLRRRQERWADPEAEIYSPPGPPNQARPPQEPSANGMADSGAASTPAPGEPHAKPGAAGAAGGGPAAAPDMRSADGNAPVGCAPSQPRPSEAQP